MKHILCGITALILTLTNLNAQKQLEQNSKNWNFGRTVYFCFSISLQNPNSFWLFQ